MQIFSLHQRLSLMRPIKHAWARMQATPSLLALCIQGMALVMVMLCAKSIYASTHGAMQMDAGFLLFSLVILQASLASLMSWIAKQAIWWRWIHLFFPVSLWLMSIYTLSNNIYLVGFVVSLSLYWTTFKTQVPFYPSRPAVWKALNRLLQTSAKPKQSLRLIDIGSGIGDMSMYMAAIRPQDQVEGIEIAPLPWLISVARATLKRSTAKFKLGNYDDLNFADYDVVFAYLSPAAMLSLWQKAHSEMRQGSLLVSLEFPIPNVAVSQTISPNKNSPTLYVYRLR
jgi:hypothetical protein